MKKKLTRKEKNRLKKEKRKEKRSLKESMDVLNESPQKQLKHRTVEEVETMLREKRMNKTDKQVFDNAFSKVKEAEEKIRVLRGKKSDITETITNEIRTRVRNRKEKLEEQCQFNGAKKRKQSPDHKQGMYSSKFQSRPM